MMKVFEDGIEVGFRFHYDNVYVLGTNWVSSSSSSSFEQNEKILKYLSELLISLPFESGSEVFHMMHSINRIISLKASPISRRVKPFFGKGNSILG